MWQIVKAEIKYFKWIYVSGLILVTIINFGLTIDDRWIEAQGDFPGLRIIWIGIGIVVFFFQLLFNKKSGRLRNYILIPLSNIQVAFTRLISFLLFWITLIIILNIFYFINYTSFPTNEWILNLISLTGFILLINSIPILNSDFYSTYFNKKSKTILGIFWGILWIGYMVLNIIFLTFFDNISPEFFDGSRKVLETYYFSNLGVALNFSFGMALFFSSLLTFKKRIHYFE